MERLTWMLILYKNARPLFRLGAEGYGVANHAWT
jgi:hypothetical protein